MEKMNYQPLLLLLVFQVVTLHAADWPMWRYDAGHTAASPEVLSEELHLHWERVLPKLEPSWPNEGTLNFDSSYSPVAAHGLLFVGSPRTDSVTAYDLENGNEKWRFYADGPVRFAPVVHQKKIYFVSDDGFLYCLESATGALKWKFRGGPNDRRILGAGRVISSWPARGAPVIADGTVYFAASIWPFMGIFIYALDAQSGNIIWANDELGAMYLRRPKGSTFSGLAPQGYLTVSGDNLIVPNGRAMPACLDRATGKLKYYSLNGGGFLKLYGKGGATSGGYAVAAADGYFYSAGSIFELTSGFKMGLNWGLPALKNNIAYRVTKTRKRKYFLHAYDLNRAKRNVGKTSWGAKINVFDVPTDWSVPLPKAPKVTILAGSRCYVGFDGSVEAIDFSEAHSSPKQTWQTKIPGSVRQLLAASGKLIAVTREGHIFCYGGAQRESKTFSFKKESSAREDHWKETLTKLLNVTGPIGEGYGLVLGEATGRLAEELANLTGRPTVTVLEDAQQSAKVRRTFESLDLAGRGVAVHTGNPLSVSYPPYFAGLVIVDDPSVSKISFGKCIDAIYPALRPYGGALCLKLNEKQHEEFSVALHASAHKGAALSRNGSWTLLVRKGALAGATNWSHQYGDSGNTFCSRDQRVKLPLGLLWFGGSTSQGLLSVHGSGPTEQVVDGRMILEEKNGLRAMDVYTGEVLWKATFPNLGEKFNYSAGRQAGALAMGTNYVACPDAVYVLYGQDCLALDIRTGKTLNTFSVPGELGAGENACWSRLSVAGDILIGCANLRQIVKGKKRVKLNLKVMASTFLFGFDRKTQKLLWHRKADHYFLHNAIAVGKGLVFCLDGRQTSKAPGNSSESIPRLRALDLRMGKEVWQTKENIFGTWLSWSKKYDVLLQAGNPANFMPGNEPRDRMIAYRGKDGTVLWEKNKYRYRGPLKIRKDTILSEDGALELLTGKLRLRSHPLTGEKAPWKFSRQGGCSPTVAGEHLLTFRSAAAGFYDMERDGGTGNFGGFRPSCTNTLIPANGVLNAPDYTAKCACGFPNRTSLALIHMPELEMWTTHNLYWLKGKRVRRMGINLGAPGDRRANDGTLWIEYPIRSGKLPNLSVNLEPKTVKWFRTYSARLSEGALKWVAASGGEGMQSLAINLANKRATPANYTIRLHFFEPKKIKTGDRIFSISLQGTEVLNNFDILGETSGAKIPVVKEFNNISVKDVLTITFISAENAKLKAAVLSGIEVVIEEKKK